MSGIHKKKSTQPAQSEHFVSSLPLDEAARLIGGLAAGQTTITLTDVNGMYWQFDIQHTPSGRQGYAGVRGTLRPWQGTYTRVDCQTYHRKPSTSRRMHALALLHTTLLISTVFLWFTGDADIQILSSTAWFLVFGVSIWLGRRFKNEVQVRDSLRLLEWVMRVFKAAGDVSIDGSNLDTRDDTGVDVVLAVIETQRELAETVRNGGTKR